MRGGIRPIQMIADRKGYVSRNPIGADDVNDIALIYGHATLLKTILPHQWTKSGVTGRYPFIGEATSHLISPARLLVFLRQTK